MPNHSKNSAVKYAPYILLIIFLIFSASCGQKTTPPSSTPSMPISASPTPAFTSQPEPSPSASPTAALPKEPTLSFTIGKGTVYQTVWSPDRSAFVVSASDAIRVYQAKSFKVLAEFPPQIESNFIFSPDGRKIAIDLSEDFFIYDLQNGQILFQLSAGVKFSSMAYKSDSSGFALIMHTSGYFWIEVYNFNSDIPLYELDKNLNQETTENSPFYGQAAFSPDDRWLSVADSHNGQVKTWDMTTGELQPVHLDHTYVYSLAYSADGQWMATGGEEKIFIWNLNSNRLVQTLTGINQMIYDLTFSNDNQQLIAEVGNYWVKFNKIFDLSTGKQIYSPVEMDNPEDVTPFLISEGYLRFGEIYFLPLVSPDSRTLIVPLFDRLVVWDMRSNQQKFVLKLTKEMADNYSLPETIKRMALTPDGKLLAVCLEDGSVDLWDITNGQWKMNIPSQKATTVTFSLDGKYLAIGGRQVVELWDIQTGQQLWHTYFSGLWIQAVDFSADNQSIMAAAGSKLGVTWLDIKNGQIQQFFSPDQDDSFSYLAGLQEQVYIAAVTDDIGKQVIDIWNLKSGQILIYFDSDVSGYVSISSINSYGNLIAGEGNREGNKNAKIWSTVTGEDLFIFPEGLKSPVFSPDQQWLVLTDEQGRLQVWDIASLADTPQLPDPATVPLPTFAASATETNRDDSVIQTNCLAVQPTLSADRQFNGRLVMNGSYGTNAYIFDLDTKERRDLPSNAMNLSTSPDGKWLAYKLYQSNNRTDSLIIENPNGKQLIFPMQEDWWVSTWLGNDLLSFSLEVDADSLDVPGTQIINPNSGPYLRLPSNYPDLRFFQGVAGSPYHFGTRNVEYNPTLQMVVYEKTVENNKNFLVLYDRVNGKELASFPDYVSEHYSNNPVWSADGKFFIAALVKECCEEVIPANLPEEWFRINRDGSAEQLTHFHDLYAEYGLFPGTISPNGNKFAFYFFKEDYEDQTLAILDLDSKVVMDTCLRKKAFPGTVVWSPDGRYLVVAEEYDQFSIRTILIDMVTMQAEQVTDDINVVPAGWLKVP